jgi:hypothetical protein
MKSRIGTPRRLNELLLEAQQEKVGTAGEGVGLIAGHLAESQVVSSAVVAEKDAEGPVARLDGGRRTPRGG